METCHFLPAAGTGLFIELVEFGVWMGFHAKDIYALGVPL